MIAQPSAQVDNGRRAGGDTKGRGHPDEARVAREDATGDQPLEALGSKGSNRWLSAIAIVKIWVRLTSKMSMTAYRLVGITPPSSAAA